MVRSNRSTILALHFRPHCPPPRIVHSRPPVHRSSLLRTLPISSGASHHATAPTRAPLSLRAHALSSSRLSSNVPHRGRFDRPTRFGQTRLPLAAPLHPAKRRNVLRPAPNVSINRAPRTPRPRPKQRLAASLRLDSPKHASTEHAQPKHAHRRPLRPRPLLHATTRRRLPRIPRPSRAQRTGRHGQRSRHGRKNPKPRSKMAKRNNRNQQLAKFSATRFPIFEKYFRSELGSAVKIECSKSIKPRYDLPVRKSKRQSLRDKVEKGLYWGIALQLAGKSPRKSQCGKLTNASIAVEERPFRAA